MSEHDTRPRPIPTEYMDRYREILLGDEICRLLNNDDDFVAVMRIHAYIESLVDRLLHTRLVPGKGLPRRMDFNSRYELAVALGLIDEYLIPALQGLSELRNHLAHNHSATVESDDIAKLRKSLKSDLKHSFEELLTEEPIDLGSDDYSKLLLRRLLLAIYSFIQSDLISATVETT